MLSNFSTYVDLAGGLSKLAPPVIQMVQRIGSSAADNAKRTVGAPSIRRTTCTGTEPPTAQAGLASSGQAGRHRAPAPVAPTA